MPDPLPDEIARRIERIHACSNLIRAQPAPGLTEPQRQLLLTVLAAAEKFVADRVTPDERWDAIVLIESCWMLIKRIFDQHADENLYGRWLTLAEASLADAYQAAQAALGSPHAFSPAHPVILLESMHSPIIYVRDSTLTTAGFSRDGTVPIERLPIPIVMSPPGEIDAPFGLMWLYHELGHHIIKETALRKRGEAALAAASLQQRDWIGWCEEILADMIGFTLGGPGLVGQIEHMLRTTAGSRFLRADAYHPAMKLRLLLLRAFAERCGAGLDGEPFAGADEAEYIGEIGRVVEALAPLLGGLVALPRENSRLVVEAREWYEDHEDRRLRLPWRLVTSAALACPGEPSRALDRLSQALPSFDWSLTSDQWDFLRDQASRMVPTLVAELDGREIKRPPVELLQTHQCISFVGLNHWQLRHALMRAFAARGRCKWRRIELYYLCDEMFDAVRRSGATTADLLREKHESLAWMLESLPAMTESYAVYEYRVPFVFASFWDCEGAPPERARMHMSPYPWGADLADARSCPAIDFVASRDGAWPDMLKAHVEGLRNLRKNAIRLGGGGET